MLLGLSGLSNTDEEKQLLLAGHMEKICQVTMKVSECSTQIMMNHRSIDYEIRGGPLLCVTHQMGEGAFSTKIFDTESGECALKQVAAQGMGYLAVVMVMYTVVASLLEGMLPGPLEIGYHSSEPHVMAHNVIASLVLKLHEEKYIKYDDLASPAAEAAARKKADDMIEAYSSRPAVLEAHITEEWVASFFLKQRPGAYADDDGGDDDGGDDSD